MKEEQLHALRHALGLNQYGKGRQDAAERITRIVGEFLHKADTHRQYETWELAYRSDPVFRAKVKGLTQALMREWEGR